MTGRMPVGKTHAIKARLIRESGKRCQGCGYQFPHHLNEHQLARDKGAFELDHKVPLARGGTGDVSNLWVLCLPCHDGKTNSAGEIGFPRNMNVDEWRSAGSPQNWERKRKLMRGG